ncbi:hypothetical protein GCG54_00012857, partial [Colletotrichum gloeosporioides]
SSETGNVIDIHAPVDGWVGTSNDRGSIEILWDCCFTVLLCCWVATHPNASSPSDRGYHHFIDKFHLAMLGLLGPDFLFLTAVGQLSNARRSVKLFNRDAEMCNRVTWTYRHAFYVDMGGLFLRSPDFQEGFPITAEELYYLVKHGHVDFPDMESMKVAKIDTADTLSRVLTVLQVIWFGVGQISRIHKGLPMTTLELTALSFVSVTIFTSVCWYWKPSVSQPKYIDTKNGKLVKEIRAKARSETHPNLPVDDNDWYRTPIHFVSGNPWLFGAHIAYYYRFLYLMRLKLLSRRMKKRLWDRVPPDIWFPAHPIFLPLVFLVLGFFGASFLLAWNFYFPTRSEQLSWRIFASYHAFFILQGGLYYMVDVYKWHQRHNAKYATSSQQPNDHELSALPTTRNDLETAVPQTPPRLKQRIYNRLHRWATAWRNLSVEDDPDMAIPLRVSVPMSVLLFLYVAGRFFVYIEDFYSLRRQPSGVYLTVNRFMPFSG